ncbi:hydroxyacid dehydrogenase [Myxococcota bacterium]|nr:hydroxyacid dehydrogenase [Myxococcota bacterium]
MRILHVEPLRYEPDLRRVIEAVGSVDWVDCADQPALLAAVALAPYEAIFARLGLAIDVEVFDHAPALRWIVTPTTGLDHIDIAEADRRGIRVISLRGETELLEHVHSTAEHTWALLLGLVRRLPHAHTDVVEGRWRREPFLADELHGKTLGIVGAGRLGRKVARYGLAFGMEVLATDTDPDALAKAPEGTQAVGVEELLARSHVVSLHLPLNGMTAGWLTKERIAHMRAGAFLVNTARGELVDEHALLDALERGHVAGAAVDVLTGDARWDEEQLPREHPLVVYARKHSNLVLTPHVGGYGRDSIHTTRRFVAERFVELVRRTRAPSQSKPRE